MPKPGTAGKVALWSNGEHTAARHAPAHRAAVCSSYAGTYIGRDNVLGVGLDHEGHAPYVLTGVVRRVVFDLKPATHEDDPALHAHAAVQSVEAGAGG